MKKVYLAGPITGLSYEESTAWREEAYKNLLHFNIEAYSPMRFKKYLEKCKILSDIGDPYKSISVLSSHRGITTRDRYDATTCDLIFVNFLGAKKVSIGTVMEVAWADLKRIPIVVCMEDEGNPHDHGMINECTGFRVNSINEGLVITKAVLTGG